MHVMHVHQCSPASIVIEEPSSSGPKKNHTDGSPISNKSIIYQMHHQWPTPDLHHKVWPTLSMAQSHQDQNSYLVSTTSSSQKSIPHKISETLSLSPSLSITDIWLLSLIPHSSSLSIPSMPSLLPKPLSPLSQLTQEPDPSKSQHHSTNPKGRIPPIEHHPTARILPPLPTQ